MHENLRVAFTGRLPHNPRTMQATRQGEARITPPNFAEQERLRAFVEAWQANQRLTSLRLGKRGDYIRRLESALERGEHIPDPCCARFAVSLYKPGGLLDTWCRFSWWKWSESVDGFCRPRDWLEWAWKKAQVDRLWHEADAKVDEAWRRFEEVLDCEEAAGEYDDDEWEKLADDHLRAINERMEVTRKTFNFSMRGRGGRQRAFEEQLKAAKAAGVSVPPNPPGHPSFFSTVLGLRPNLQACLTEASAWLDHLRDVKLNTEQDPVDHVLVMFRPDQLADEFLDELAAHRAAFEVFLRQFGRWATHGVWDLDVFLSCHFFRDVLVAAVAAEQKFEQRNQRLWDEDWWKKHRLAAARRVLAELSDGVITPRKIRDHERHSRH